MSITNEKKDKTVLIEIISYLWNQVILPNIIWTAIIGIPSALVSAYGIYQTVSFFFSSGTLATPWLIATIFALTINTITFFIGIIFCIYYFRKMKKNLPSFPALTFDYRILESEYELYFETREKIYQTQTVHLEALSDNLNEVSHNMTWTGQNYIGSKLDSSCTGLSLIDTNRTSPPYPVVIRFDRALTRGNKESYRFTTEVEDPSLSMMPYLAKLIKCQTEKLTIKVTVPKGMIKNPCCCISTDATRDIILDTPTPLQAKHVGPYELYEWTIENLELLRCYSICWEFS